MSLTTTFNFITPQPGALISAAIFEGTSLQHFTKLYNVRNKTEITSLTGIPTLQGPTCEFNPQSGRVLTPRSIEVVYYKLEDAICLDQARLLPQSDSQEIIDANLGEYLSNHLLESLNRTIDGRVWISSTASVTSSGLWTMAKADTGAVRSTATASITTSNAIDQYNSFYNLAPDGVKYNDSVTFMPMSDIITMAQSQLSTNAGQRIIEKVGPNEWQYTINPNNKIVPVNAFASGQWFLSTTRNLFAAVNMDQAELVVSRTNVLDDRIGMKASFFLGVQYGVSADVVVR